MGGKLKLRIGDTVYHQALALGRGKVRYIYRDEVLVAFEKAPAARYPRDNLSKCDPTPVAQAGSG